MKKGKTTIRLTLRIPERLNQKIRNEAERKGVSINQILLSLISHSLQ